MVNDFLLASAHHIAVLMVVALLASELVLLRQPVSATALRSLARTDSIYGIGAGVLLFIGIARVFWGAKDASFYAGSVPFWIKVTLFVAIGLMSIIPTLRIIRWSRAFKATQALPDAQAWAATRRWVSGQFHLLSLLVIAAAAMARGLG